MTEKLLTFLKSYVIRDKKKQQQTHTWVSSALDRILTLSIPQERRAEFFSLYHAYVTSSQYKLDHLESAIAITEKVITSFPLFADVDFKIHTFEQHGLDIYAFSALMTQVIHAWKSVVEEIYGNVEMISAFRMSYKCHLHFPHVIVNKPIAQEICRRVHAQLCEKIPSHKAVWKDILDTTVYSTGLRMLWSQKGHMTRDPEERIKHEAAFPDEPFNSVYRIGDLIDNVLHLKKTAELQDLVLTSIHVYHSIGLTPCDLVRQIQEATNAVSSKVQHEKALKAVTDKLQHVSIDGNNDEEMDPTTMKRCEQVIEAMRGELEEMFAQVSIHQLSTFKGSGDPIITLPPQICPFIKRMHKRTEERNVPTNYIVEGNDSILVKCWKCADQKFRIPLPDHLHVKKDSIQDSQQSIILHCVNLGTHEAVSEYVFQNLKDTFAATPGRGGTYKHFYYDFDLHRWVEYEKLLLTIMQDNGPIQKPIKEIVHKVWKDPNVDEEKKKELVKNWMKLRKDLQNTTFVKNGVMPILSRKLDFRWRVGSTCFEERLDQNPTLIGMRNGVYDLRAKVFRPGRPCDFISMSTHISYIPYENIQHDVRKGLENFLSSILTNEEHCRYVLMEMASALDGTPSQQRFFIWSGAGANGKSSLVRLLEFSLGDLVGTAQTALITKERPSSNAPTADIASQKGKRYVIFSECNERDTLYLGTVKGLCGGDRQTARKLYENDQTFKLQATYFMLTNNIPTINSSSSDFGTWRRIRLVTFDSKFVDNPNPNNPHEHKVDDTLNDKLPQWAEAFASLLIKYYCEYKVPTIPAAFRRAWLQLQNKNDVVLRFCKSMLSDEVDSENGDVPFTDVENLWELFRAWLKTLGVNKNITRDNFERQMVHNLGQFVRHGNMDGWNVEYKARAQIMECSM